MQEIHKRVQMDLANILIRIFAAILSLLTDLWWWWLYLEGNPWLHQVDCGVWTILALFINYIGLFLLI